MASLVVSLNSTPVGLLSELPDGRISFRFNDLYMGMDNRPVLGQKFEDDLQRTYIGKKPGQLPAFFGNLLPEGRVRTVIETSLNREGCSDIELLEMASNDLPGAVVLTRSDEGAMPAEDNAQRSEDEKNTEDIGLRFSLAGVQLKFSAVEDDERFTIPSHDSVGDWIIKVAVKGYEGLSSNEYFVMNWARLAGFDVPDMRLVSYDALGALKKYVPENASAFAIRRFDRSDKRRVHQEDFNQVLGRFPRADRREKYDFSYDELAVLVKAIAGLNGAREFLKRLLFVIASGNHDAHLKNWSLLYPDGIHPVLSPLYDQVATVGWADMDRTWALKLGGSREFGRADRATFIKLASKVDLEKRAAEDLLLETLTAIREAWAQTDKSIILDSHRHAIIEHWTRVPILREAGSL